MQHCVKHKGLAPVVGVVLIILIGVIAVAALGVYVFKIKDAPQLSPTVTCLDAQTRSPVRITSACYNATSKGVQLGLYREDVGFAYSSLLFTLEGTGSSTSWTCGEGCGLCSLGALGTTKQYYSLPLDAMPSILKVLANGCELVSRDIGIC